MYYLKFIIIYYPLLYYFILRRIYYFSHVLFKVYYYMYRCIKCNKLPYSNEIILSSKRRLKKTERPTVASSTVRNFCTAPLSFIVKRKYSISLLYYYILRKIYYFSHVLFKEYYYNYPLLYYYILRRIYYFSHVLFKV